MLQPAVATSKLDDEELLCQLLVQFGIMPITKDKVWKGRGWWKLFLIRRLPKKAGEERRTSWVVYVVSGRGSRGWLVVGVAADRLCTSCTDP